MQLPLAAGQQGRQAFKLLSGSSRLHEVLSIEGLWQEKRTHPIKRSGYLFFLECKRHSQQLRSFNWHPNWHLTCAGKICHQRKVIWSHAAGYWLHTLQERMCLASCKESTNLLLKSKIFSSCLWHTFLWKEMQQDCAPCKANPCRDWVEAALKKQTGDQTCSFEALFWVAGFGQNHVGEVLKELPHLLQSCHLTQLHMSSCVQSPWPDKAGLFQVRKKSEQNIVSLTPVSS